MIGGLFAKVRASIAAAAAVTRQAFDRRTQRKPPAAPGEALRFIAPARSPGRRRRPDAARQAAAQAKRDRKNATRRRDSIRCYEGNRARCVQATNVAVWRCPEPTSWHLTGTVIRHGE